MRIVSVQSFIFTFSLHIFIGHVNKWESEECPDSSVRTILISLIARGKIAKVNQRFWNQKVSFIICVLSWFKGEYTYNLQVLTDDIIYMKTFEMCENLMDASFYKVPKKTINSWKVKIRKCFNAEKDFLFLNGSKPNDV